MSWREARRCCPPRPQDGPAGRGGGRSRRLWGCPAFVLRSHCASCRRHRGKRLARARDISGVSCRSGWSEAACSQLTTTSVSWVQAILLPQPPRDLGFLDSPSIQALPERRFGWPRPGAEFVQRSHGRLPGPAPDTCSVEFSRGSPESPERRSPRPKPRKRLSCSRFQTHPHPWRLLAPVLFDSSELRLNQRYPDDMWGREEARPGSGGGGSPGKGRAQLCKGFLPCQLAGLPPSSRLSAASLEAGREGEGSKGLRE
ncbi:PREDICTED: uncharacterized protein LOC105504401 [Colobus angolensis palliatus]|uniref:uncharacterized protein LOC105504401 n=1 Tax=Colobus angolensis palliatus TaxID=336983 RepID=UPI0005F47266|nr:PREDICTED: uncharacterized protein LOC105504401 [Colobus angolensis palliatus]